MIRIELIDHVAFTSNDVDNTAAWYARVFSMERRFEDAWPNESTYRGNPTVMCNGDACVALFRSCDTQTIIEPENNPNRHFALKVNRENFERIQSRLTGLGIEARLWDHKICHSLYINDPDGHQVEVTTYDVQAATPRDINK